MSHQIRRQSRLVASNSNTAQGALERLLPVQVGSLFRKFGTVQLIVSVRRALITVQTEKRATASKLAKNLRK